MKTQITTVLFALALGCGPALAQEQNQNAANNQGGGGSQAQLAFGEGQVDSIKGLMNQFRALREAWIADREAKLEQLRNCTEEERQLILRELEQAQEQLKEQHRLLAKQLREETRRIREMRRNGAN